MDVRTLMRRAADHYGNLEAVVSGVGDVAQSNALLQVVDSAPADHRDGKPGSAVQLAKKLASLLGELGVLWPRHDVGKSAVKVQRNKDLPFRGDPLED